jgi:hypothetical protein
VRAEGHRDGRAATLFMVTPQMPAEWRRVGQAE